jgi:hypothetical protein
MLQRGRRPLRADGVGLPPIVGSTVATDIDRADPLVVVGEERRRTDGEGGCRPPEKQTRNDIDRPQTRLRVYSTPFGV